MGSVPAYAGACPRAVLAPARTAATSICSTCPEPVCTQTQPCAMHNHTYGCVRPPTCQLLQAGQLLEGGS